MMGKNNRSYKNPTIFPTLMRVSVRRLMILMMESLTMLLFPKHKLEHRQTAKSFRSNRYHINVKIKIIKHRNLAGPIDMTIISLFWQSIKFRIYIFHSRLKIAYLLDSPEED